ncbi:immunity protein Imm33 domain-containing protein [Planctobacterium marinum]|uniref:Imm33-like domain-containing protein n=1 Tax=Planctobacterium marinum TaxID=1631968 RepID=A0AA48KN58_9ALTE|nr:hypothetical protein MACH26_06820 [Planctobacterium marinum]
MNLAELQRLCCEHYGESFESPELDQLVAISEGVIDSFEDIELEGVRYHSPDHMSGWWLTTNLYTGDVSSLKTVHFRHIAEKRPEIAQYMALPIGYRFVLGGDSEHVWFDQKVKDDV